MHRFARRALICYGFIAITASANHAHGDSLNRIESNDPDRFFPLWLSESEAKQDGYLKWEEFRPGVRTFLEQRVKRTRELREHHDLQPGPDGCFSETRQFNRHDYIPNQTLDELATSFAGIYRGEVIGEAQGFLDGRPGTLYEVSILSGPPNAPPEVYVYYPLARIHAEGEVLCHKGDRLSDHPIVGRQMLVFAKDPGVEVPVILTPQDEELFFERLDGSLSLPQGSASMAAVTLRAIETEALRLKNLQSQGSSRQEMRR